jgi:hypothetical protein
MARDHVEFAYAQHLDWRSAAFDAMRGSLSHKMLSHDPDTGAASLIVRFPPGYQRVIRSTFEEEIYVLDGEVEIDGTSLRRDGYAALGRGRQAVWSSPNGAAAMLWLDVSSETEPESLLTRDVLATPWDPDSPPPRLEYMMPRSKTLKCDCNTGAPRTFLLCTMPQNYPPNWEIPEETHPCAEELFMLGGDISGPRGVMRQGAYFWRPKETLHGPFASREGGLAIIRFRDGPHVNNWQADPVPFRYDCPYDPILPANFVADFTRQITLDSRY